MPISSTHRFWGSLIVLGIVLRLGIWWFTVGSNDVAGWLSHAQHLITLGLPDTYRAIALYNHPPLAGLYAVFAWEHSGTDLLVFGRLLKLPGLLGEALALLALWRVGGVRLAGMYAVLPAPILVGAYHGNTDCLAAALALLAAMAWDRQRYAAAGLALAAALNVKLIPLIVVPLFFVAAPSWAVGLRFALALGIGMLPFLPPALQAGDAMHKNMIAYNSSADDWGFLALLNAAVREPMLEGVATPLRAAFLATGRYLIMGSVLALAVVSRRRLRLPMREQVAVASAVFLFFAPGFGVQYVVFVAAVLLSVNARAGVFWGITSGLFIGGLYASFLIPGPIWFSRFRAPFPVWPVVAGVVAWAGLGFWIWRHLAGAWRRTAEPAVTAAPPAPPSPATPRPATRAAETGSRRG